MCGQSSLCRDQCLLKSIAVEDRSCSRSCPAAADCGAQTLWFWLRYDLKAGKKKPGGAQTLSGFCIAAWGWRESHSVGQRGPIPHQLIEIEATLLTGTSLVSDSVNTPFSSLALLLLASMASGN